jgi:hypothetical protein
MLRTALAEPATRTRVMQLLTGDDEQERRQRRLAELATELDGMELTIRLGKDDDGTARNDP